MKWEGGEIDEVFYRYRESEDKLLNAEGKKLLEMCMEQGLRVLNGRIKGVREGKWTHICADGCSVLDYIIVSENEGACPIETMQIETRIESYHLPVGFNLEIIIKNKGKYFEIRNKKVQRKV